MPLVEEYHPNSIKTNQNAKKEYGRLCNESLLSALFFMLPTSDTMTMALLNEVSLRKYYDDILSDIDLIYNDVLSLTETQLDLDEDKPEEIYQNFTIKTKKEKAFLNIFLITYRFR